MTVNKNPFTDSSQEKSKEVIARLSPDPFLNVDGDPNAGNLLNIGINAKIEDSTYYKIAAAVVIAIIIGAISFFAIKTMFTSVK